MNDWILFYLQGNPWSTKHKDCWLYFRNAGAERHGTRILLPARALLFLLAYLPPSRSWVYCGWEHRHTVLIQAQVSNSDTIFLRNLKGCEALIACLSSDCNSEETCYYFKRMLWEPSEGMHGMPSALCCWHMTQGTQHRLNVHRCYPLKSLALDFLVQPSTYAGLLLFSFPPQPTPIWFSHPSTTTCSQSHQEWLQP